MFAITSTLALAIIIPLPPYQQASDAQVKDLLIQFQADKEALNRLWTVPLSKKRTEAMTAFYDDWVKRLSAVDAKSPIQSLRDKIDLTLLKNHITYQIKLVNHNQIKNEELRDLMGFANTLVEICEKHALRIDTDLELNANTLHKATKNIQKLKESSRKITPVIGRRLKDTINQLQSSLDAWYRFHAEYDPHFTWWCKEPWQELQKELKEYARFAQKEWAGIDPEDTKALVGNPIGRNALIDGIEHEMIPYTPEELLEIAEKEFQWCEKEMIKTMEDLKCNTWQEALDVTKEKHVAPGEQPNLIKELADEAVEFLEERNLLSIPNLAKQVWRMQMMSPERQKYSPYFTGGEVISIAYPTAQMSHEEKIMSMRGNNRHFARATVHHELIPGHHLQGYMAKRWNTQRRMFYTPFLVEGWALYWELRLWDLNFQKSAEDRVGMLFWRSHRCARILFSLNFHLGNWSPQECVDFLVRRVGHERNNAEAEVRRSIQGGYGPLYQAAYMLGGLQIRALHKEIVGSGKMPEKEFHDHILKQNSIPVAAIRASFGFGEANSAMRTWRFYD